MNVAAATPRLSADEQVRRRLLIGVGVSVLLHALVLSLRFGVPGLGSVSGSAAINVRIAPSVPPPAEAPPLPPVPERARMPVTGMRLVPPRPAAPPLAVVAEPAPSPTVGKMRQTRKARRVSSPTTRMRVEEPPRVIAQDAEPNDFLVAVPQPEESDLKTLDPLETQHGEDEGKDNAAAMAQAEREQEQQRLAEADRLERERLESERLAAQARREQQQAAELAAQRDSERQAEQERLAREAAAQKLEQERALAERARQERLAAMERQQQERRIREQLEEQRLAQERAAQERLLRERAQQERLAQERAEQERVAQERAAQERLNKERAEQERAAQERLAQERAARERQAREQAEQERLAQQRRPPPSDDPFALGPGVGSSGGGSGGGSGPGAGGAGQRVAQDLPGTDLSNRARELVRGLDLLKGAPPPAAAGNRRIVVGAAERDVPLRLYVDSWRMKIERTGAIHYPRSWASAGRADPLVSVAVRSDGTVEDVTIIRSSGRPDMDDKVRQIVRLNARYSQFPPNIASRYDVIDIRRIWRFDDVLKLIEELP